MTAHEHATFAPGQAVPRSGRITVVRARQRRADEPVEVAERKGWGHPDTLADALGEALSVAYACYTREVFGVVLHHQFDKVGIMGGRVEVGFGGGRLTQPVRVLLNGRASSRFGGQDIPVRDLLEATCRDFFAARFPMLDPARDLRILYEVGQGGSPGGLGTDGEQANRRSRWFEPASRADLPELAFLACNDTSSGVAFSPPTPVEQLVLAVEEVLAGTARPAWLGTDIKVMAHRVAHTVHLTVAIPQMAAHVPSLNAYRSHLAEATDRLIVHGKRCCPDIDLRVWVNTRDDLDRPELYLTFTGSSIETGDEGFVGRGNRYGGLIAANRPYTMEGISGKNPVYHTGKVYCVGASLVADRIWTETGHGAEVVLLGQSGRAVVDPWATLVRVEPAADGAMPPPAEAIEPLVADTLAGLPDSVDGILTGAFRLH